MAAQKALANEAYLEEYNRLDLELKQLQHELADTVRVNDDLTKQIAQKVRLSLHLCIYLCTNFYPLWCEGGRVVDKG